MDSSEKKKTEKKDRARKCSTGSRTKLMKELSRTCTLPLSQYSDKMAKCPGWKEPATKTARMAENIA